MSRKTVRSAILVLGLFTAIVHLVILPFVVSKTVDFLYVAWILNGIGYLVLLWATLAEPSFLEGSRDLVHYAFIGFTAVTIIAFFAFGSWRDDVLGWVTKADEVLLMVALALDLRMARGA